MIKKFFLTMLGTIAGIWVSIIVFVLGSIIAIGILVGKNADTSAIAGGDSILRIDLSGQIVDRVQPGSFMDVLMSASEGNTQGLDDLVAAIMKARDDKKSKASSSTAPALRRALPHVPNCSKRSAISRKIHRNGYILMPTRMPRATICSLRCQTKFTLTPSAKSTSTACNPW